MKLYFIRHGESVANANSIISTLDTPLTKKGEEQSRIVGHSLLDKNVTIIICSPLLRARQTAMLIANMLNVPPKNIKILDELKERGLGRLAGFPRKYKKEFYYKTNSAYGLEPRNLLIKRMRKAFAKIKLITKTSTGNTLIIGHAVSGFYFLQITKGNLNFDMFDDIKHIDNAIIDVIRL